jgi:S-adenosylmethionine-diacylgycerolhomoserine-N-methlytransferase
VSDAAAQMDRMYRRQRHIYDASRKFYLLGRDEMIAGVNAGAGDSVLEIGCGTGRNLIKLAQTYPQARCCGLDVSQVMLDTAAASIARAGLQQRIRLAQGDATNFDAQALFGRERFERIVISYALSMIPSWREALGHAIDALAPGGSLHIVDFGDQAGLPGPFRVALNLWLAAFDVTPRATLQAELTGMAEKRDARASVAFRLRGYAILGKVERHAAF